MIGDCPPINKSVIDLKQQCFSYDIGNTVQQRKGYLTLNAKVWLYKWAFRITLEVVAWSLFWWYWESHSAEKGQQTLNARVWLYTFVLRRKWLHGVYSVGMKLTNAWLLDGNVVTNCVVRGEICYARSESQGLLYESKY